MLNLFASTDIITCSESVFIVLNRVRSSLNPDDFRKAGNRNMDEDVTQLTANRNPVGKKTRIFLTLLLFLPCLLIPTGLDNDIWFLLNSGRYVLQHGIPYIEPFTLHQNMQFVMQQWLSAVVFWGVFAKLGAAGLIALVSVMFGCTVAVIYRTTRLLSDGNFLTSFLLTFLTVSFLTPFMTTRPIIFTLFLLSLELYLLERFIAAGGFKWLIPLPFLSALLVNLHAAMWPVQFVLFLPYLIDSFRFKFRIIEGQGYPKKILLPAVAAMIAAGFANPYGLDAMTYLLRSYGFAEINLVFEMQPANINNLLGKVIFGTLLLIIAIYFFYKKGKTRLRYVLLTVGTAILALSSTRSFVLFVLCSFFPLAYYLKDLSIPQSKAVETTKGARALRAVLIVLLVGMLGYIFVSKYIAAAKTDELPKSAPAVDYLAANGDQDNMRLYTGYDDGGYAEFMGFKPYIDPRAEVFVKKNNGVDDIMREYYRLQDGETYYKYLLDKYDFTHLLVGKYDILNTYLPYDGDYRMIYNDGEYAIFVKR